jgi:hypothetical protein
MDAARARQQLEASYARARERRDKQFAALYALDKRAPPSAERLASFRAYVAANPWVPLPPPPPDPKPRAVPRAKAAAKGPSAERLASYRVYAAANPVVPLPPPPPDPRAKPKVVRFATAEDLVAARRSLGPVIGERGFTEYVRATHGQVSQEVVRDFIRGQEPAQVFAAPAAADGKQATTGKKDSWLVDLISLPQGDPIHKYIMIAQNVYTSYLLAEPLESTKAVDTAAAFQTLVDRSPPKQGPPQEITTDGSNTEWRGAFTEKLDALGIVRRVKQKEDRQAMAKLDATIQRVKALLIRPVIDAQEGEEADDRPWSEMLPEVIQNYNERLPGPEGTFGSPPGRGDW